MMKKHTARERNPGEFDDHDEISQRAERVAAFNQHLLEGAKRALTVTGQSALEFLIANPAVSTIDLAKRLGRGASAIGLAMAIYDEAVQSGIVRDVAKDMLIREIHAAFPHGWPGLSLVSPIVAVGSWDSELARYCREPRIAEYSRAIIRDLAIDNPPPRFWKPEAKDDPLIDALFDRYWPVAAGGTP